MLKSGNPIGRGRPGPDPRLWRRRRRRQRGRCPRDGAPGDPGERQRLDRRQDPGGEPHPGFAVSLRGLWTPRAMVSRPGRSRWPPPRTRCGPARPPSPPARGAPTPPTAAPAATVMPVWPRVATCASAGAPESAAAIGCTIWPGSAPPIPSPAPSDQCAPGGSVPLQPKAVAGFLP